MVVQGHAIVSTLSFLLQMMIYAGIFCCLSPILSIAAFLSYKSPFTYTKEEVVSNAIKIYSFFSNLSTSKNNKKLFDSRDNM